MKKLAIVSLLLLSTSAFAQEPSPQDDFCKECEERVAPPPASVPTDEALQAAEHERRAMEVEAKRGRIHRLKLAGGLLLGFGTAAMPIGAVLGLVSIDQALGCLFNSSPACQNPSNATFNASMTMFAIGTPMVIAGITLLAVATHEKKKLGNLETIDTPARDLVSSLGVAPITSNGTTSGGVVQWNLSF